MLFLERLVLFLERLVLFLERLVLFLERLVLFLEHLRLRHAFQSIHSCHSRRSSTLRWSCSCIGNRLRYLGDSPSWSL